MKETSVTKCSMYCAKSFTIFLVDVMAISEPLRSIKEIAVGAAILPGKSKTPVSGV